MNKPISAAAVVVVQSSEGVTLQLEGDPNGAAFRIASEAAIIVRMLSTPESPPEAPAFCYSFTGEDFFGRCATVQDAIAEAIAEAGDRKTFYVGTSTPPPSPETYWNAEDWLEHVSCQDEYAGEYADGWDCSTKEQRKMLEDAVQPLLRSWLHANKLMPRFFTVRDVKAFAIQDDGTAAQTS